MEDKRASVLALGLGSPQEVGRSRVFLDARTEEGESFRFSLVLSASS